MREIDIDNCKIKKFHLEEIFFQNWRSMDLRIVTKLKGFKIRGIMRLMDPIKNDSKIEEFSKITWKNKSIWINGSKNGSKMEGLLDECYKELITKLTHSSSDEL